MIKKISHVMMWAADLERTKKWYSEKLGFQVSYYAPKEFLSLIHPDMGRLDFHATGGDSSQIGKGAMPYYIVQDIEKVKSWLESRGISVGAIEQVSESPKHTWFTDCEGNSLGIEEF